MALQKSPGKTWRKGLAWGLIHSSNASRQCENYSQTKSDSCFSLPSDDNPDNNPVKLIINYYLTIMTTAIATPLGDIAQFKVDIDTLLEKRRYFIERILPTLVEGQDYYVIKGKKSLGKAGAEKLAGIYNLVAIFKRDEATMKSFSKIEGLIAYVCRLQRPDGSIAGQGRGSSVITSNGGDVNKTIKMAQKSAFIDGVIRATGLSGTFTQDLDSMPLESIQAPRENQLSATVDDIPFGGETSPDEGDNPDIPYERIQNTEGIAGMITAKQKTFLENLAYEHINSENERERFLADLDGMTKEDASESISSFLMAGSRR